MKLINISFLWDARHEVQGYMTVYILFYFTQNPCSSKPCLNNGTCSVFSFRDGTYKCNCHPGYLGNRCEIGNSETLELFPKKEIQPIRDLPYLDRCVLYVCVGGCVCGRGDGGGGGGGGNLFL